ncbi:MAG: hypothetical protein HQK53_20130, partial [Oligoflexia bacterium]|nr:hypothetical protein [Oligoflexia bacterium]
MVSNCYGPGSLTGANGNFEQILQVLRGLRLRPNVCLVALLLVVFPSHPNPSLLLYPSTNYISRQIQNNLKNLSAMQDRKIQQEKMQQEKILQEKLNSVAIATTTGKTRKVVSTGMGNEGNGSTEGNNSVAREDDDDDSDDSDEEMFGDVADTDGKRVNEIGEVANFEIAEHSGFDIFNDDNYLATNKKVSGSQIKLDKLDKLDEISGIASGSSTVSVANIEKEKEKEKENVEVKAKELLSTDKWKSEGNEISDSENDVVLLDKLDLSKPARRLEPVYEKIAYTDEMSTSLAKNLVVEHSQSMDSQAVAMSSQMDTDNTSTTSTDKSEGDTRGSQESHSLDNQGNQDNQGNRSDGGSDVNNGNKDNQEVIYYDYSKSNPMLSKNENDRDVSHRVQKVIDKTIG